SSKASNQMPPQPLRQASTVNLPMVTEVRVLKHAGQIMIVRTSGCRIEYSRAALCRRGLFQLNRRGNALWQRVGFVGENDLDGVETVGAPLVFLEQPRFDKLGHRLPARVTDEGKMPGVGGVARQRRRDAFFEF